MDVCVSKDGSRSTQVSDSPRTPSSSSAANYDYNTIVAPAGRKRRGLAICIFGPNRGILDFFDPTQ